MTSPKPITLEEQIRACEIAHAIVMDDLTSRQLKAAAATLRELQQGKWVRRDNRVHDITGMYDD